MEFQEQAARELSALVDRLTAAADRRVDETLERTRREHEAAMASLGAQLERQTQALDASVRDRHELVAAQQGACSQLAMLRAHAEAQRAELDRQHQHIDLQRRLAAANLAELDRLPEAAAALADAQAEALRLTRQFESALEELREEHVTTLQQQAIARSDLPLDELLAIFGALATATTPNAVLATVVAGLRREFSRVALFRVRSSRLECVSHAGFESAGDVARVVIPTGVDCLLTRAVNSRRTETFIAGSSDDRSAMAFRGTPACAVALPLIIGDLPVAVVYADDSDQLEFAAAPAQLLVKFAEIVWQHAVLVMHRASAAQLGPAQIERLA